MQVSLSPLQNWGLQRNMRLQTQTMLGSCKSNCTHHTAAYCLYVLGICLTVEVWLLHFSLSLFFFPLLTTLPVSHFAFLFEILLFILAVLGLHCACAPHGFEWAELWYVGF